MTEFFPNRPGVYKIINNVTGDIYVGSSNNLRTRKNHHFHKLRSSEHVNVNLQNAYDEYGEDSFEFKVIEECDLDQCLEREQIYIDNLNPVYNINPSADGMTGYKHTEETKDKISKAMKKSTNRLPDKMKESPSKKTAPRRIPKGRDPRSLRNLSQFKHMTDEEWDEYYKQSIEEDTKPDEDIDSITGMDPAEFKGLVERQMERFKQDYDLSDMKINDIETLKALSEASVFLEIFSERSYHMMGAITTENLLILDKLETWRNNLIKSVTILQKSLGIDRESRNAEGSESLIEEIDEIKRRANEFYERKHQYIYCPNDNCTMLLATAWYLYPENDNELKLHCNRCNESFIVNSARILENGGRNVEPNDAGIYPVPDY